MSRWEGVCLIALAMTSENSKDFFFFFFLAQDIPVDQAGLLLPLPAKCLD